MTFQNQVRSVDSSKIYDVGTELRPLGAHTQNTTLNAVVTIAIPESARYIKMGATAQNISYTLDGTAPTSTLGFVLYTGVEPTLLMLGQGTTLKVIERAGGGKIDYQFFS